MRVDAVERRPREFRDVQQDGGVVAVESVVRITRNLHAQGCVALLQPVPLRLKAPKPREDDFEPQTLGDHIRRRRLALGLDQKCAASRLGVTIATVSNWEGGRAYPAIGRIPAVLEFLNYDPFPGPSTVPERLLAERRARGWSVREAARQLGVDPTTWGEWERGKTILFRSHRALVARLLELPKSETDEAMAASWVRSHMIAHHRATTKSVEDARSGAVRRFDS